MANAMKPKMNSVDKKAYRSTIELNERELPQIKDWHVGKKYTVVLEMEMTGIRKQNDYASMPMPEMSQAMSGARQEPPKILTGEFKIMSVGVEEPDK